MAVAGKVSGIYRKDGASVAFANLALLDSGDHKTYHVPIADTAHRYWDKLQQTTVTVDLGAGAGFQPPVGEYEIQHPSGYVVFKMALPDIAVVHVSGQAFTLVQVAGAFGWTLDLKTETLDATTFEGNGWKVFVTSFKEYSAKIEKFWVNDDLPIFNIELLFVFFVSKLTDQSRFEGWGIINQESITVSVGELIKAPLSIQGTDGIYFRRDA